MVAQYIFGHAGLVATGTSSTRGTGFWQPYSADEPASRFCVRGLLGAMGDPWDWATSLCTTNLDHGSQSMFFAGLLFSALCAEDHVDSC